MTHINECLHLPDLQHDALDLQCIFSVSRLWPDSMVAFDSTIARDSMQKSSATALCFYAFTDNFDQQYSQLNFRLSTCNEAVAEDNHDGGGSPFTILHDSVETNVRIKSNCVNLFRRRRLGSRFYQNMMVPKQLARPVQVLLTSLIRARKDISRARGSRNLEARGVCG